MGIKTSAQSHVSIAIKHTRLQHTCRPYRMMSAVPLFSVRHLLKTRCQLHHCQHKSASSNAQIAAAVANIMPVLTVNCCTSCIIDKRSVLLTSEATNINIEAAAWVPAVTCERCAQEEKDKCRHISGHSRLRVMLAAGCQRQQN